MEEKRKPLPRQQGPIFSCGQRRLPATRFNVLIINCPENGANREPEAAMAVVRRFEIVAVEGNAVRVDLIFGRGQPIVAVQNGDLRAVAVARRRQENRTSSLHLRPLGKSVAVTCPVTVTR